MHVAKIADQLEARWSQLAYLVRNFVEVMKPTNDKTLKEKDPTLQIDYLNTISDSFLLA